MSQELKKDVASFWNRNVNQLNQLQREDVGSPEFFESALALRYKYHYHLLPMFDRLAQKFPGGKLLEIGCSMGNDSYELAKRGFQVTGVDITERAIDLVQQRFRMLDMSGTFQVADAEHLPFEDNTFDVIYSFGVLHHTPNTDIAINEVHRVLRPNGKASIMLYNKFSLNYLAHSITKHPFDGSKEDPCPVEKAYYVSEVKKLFEKFAKVEISVDYLFGYGWGKANALIPKPLHRAFGKYLGWHIMIDATK